MIPSTEIALLLIWGDDIGASAVAREAPLLLNTQHRVVLSLLPPMDVSLGRRLLQPVPRANLLTVGTFCFGSVLDRYVMCHTRSAFTEESLATTAHYSELVRAVAGDS